MEKKMRSKIFANHIVYRYVCNSFFNKWKTNPLIKHPLETIRSYYNLQKEMTDLFDIEFNKFEGKLDRDILQFIREVGLKYQASLKSGSVNSLLYMAETLFVLHQWMQDNPDVERINILETGTGKGFSALCFAKVFQLSRRAGQVTTLDLLPHNIPILWNLIDDHLEGPRSRADLLKPYRYLLDNHITFVQVDSMVEINRVALSRIHFGFIDGLHTGKAVKHEVSYVSLFQLPGDIIVIDDVCDEFPDIFAVISEICDELGYVSVDSSNLESNIAIIQKQ
jgi:hypothetical protein